jgi:hypothetical protein
MGILHVWPQEPRKQDGVIQLSAAIEVPGRERMVLWYKIPESQQQRLSVTHDHFVVGAIYLMMQTGVDVRIHGQVSPSLLRNLIEFQSAWVAMQPHLACVNISADLEQEPEMLSGRDQAIMAFSAGVDSCFTAFRHARSAGVRFPFNIGAGIMVHGFDIPLEDTEAFALAVARSERILSSLGIALIPIATNYRQLVEVWRYSFAAALSSCLRIFSGGFSHGLIGQGLTYREIRSYTEGSNSLTDPLLSCDSFRIVPDGAAFERFEKILAMRDWPEFLHNLRVCWQGSQKDRNCCACEKCMRNILTFRALGLGLPPCFPNDVDVSMLRTMRMGRGTLPYIRYGELARLAAASGSQGPWMRVIEKRLTTYRYIKVPGILYLLHRWHRKGSRTWNRLLGRDRATESSESIKLS